MCISDKKIHFCTCSEKIEVSKDIPDEIMYLHSQEYTKAMNAFYKEDNSYLSTYFKWTLSRYSEEKTKSHMVIGSIVYPENSLNETITKDQILKILNSESPFDFTYVPEELDTLVIEERYTFIELEEHPRPHKHRFLSFKYVGGNWIFGRLPQNYLFEDLNIGKVQSKIEYTISDLKAKTDKELVRLINQKAKEIDSGIFNLGFDDVNSGFKDIYLISQLNEKIKNIGFELLFLKSEEYWLKNVMNSFERVGAEQHIKLITKAQNYFNNEFVNDKFNRDFELNEMGSQYYKLKDQLILKVAKLIRENYNDYIV